MATEFREYTSADLYGFFFDDCGQRVCLLRESDVPNRVWLGLRDEHCMSLNRETAAGIIEKLQVFVDTGKL